MPNPPAQCRSATALPSRPLALLRDLTELAKPRITLLVLFTTAVGLLLTRAGFGPWRALAFLVATACLVASANTLNCWYERESDRHMLRTQDRALPTGRLGPGVALASGLVLGAAALAGLAATTNPLTTGLGALALATYVLAYTPLKRVSWWALLVGAVPGAIPPLMGATAESGRIGAAGVVLAGILFFWQLPHFIAIALHHKEDYRRGGLRVLPLVHGDAAARRHLFAYTVLLVLVSLAALPLGMAGLWYLAAALALGAGFLLVAAGGLRPAVEAAWARRAFAYSLVYLPLLIGVLVLDAR
jgi:protoheme IX farnesyltransferase